MLGRIKDDIIQHGIEKNGILKSCLDKGVQYGNHVREFM